MSHTLSRVAAASAAVLACGIAHADDLDVLVVGPNGHSSVTLYGQSVDFHADAALHANGRKVGDLDATDHSVVIAGTWAPSDRISLTARLPYTTSNSTTLTVGPVTSSQHETGAGGMLDASGWLIGSAMSPGFRLGASVGADKHAGQSTSTYLALLPQWRFNESLVLSSRVGVAHGSDEGSSQFANVYLVWRAAPAWSLAPSVGYTHWNGTDGDGSYDDTRAGVSATWHVGQGWAASVQYDHVERSDRSASGSSVDLVNGHFDAWFLGVRKTF